LLRIIAGLEEPDSGSAIVGGQPPAGLTGNIGYLTQHHTLLPWLRVRDNIALPMRLRETGRSESGARAIELAASLGLAGSVDLYPYELSGGMQRRAALGRLLAQEAGYWLLDEPFSNLDERTSHSLQELLLSLVREHRLSVVFVTHSVDEAAWIGDRIEVLSASPGTVAESFEPGLPRPRNRLSEEYGAVMERIRKSLESVLIND
jgi:NitT/TauT family transport system ATP-binding protein